MKYTLIVVLFIFLLGIAASKGLKHDLRDASQELSLSSIDVGYSCALEGVSREDCKALVIAAFERQFE